MSGRSPSSARTRRGPNQGSRPVPLVMISDHEGSAALGWVGPGVLYGRLTGGVSAGIGSDFAAELQAFAQPVEALSLFADFSGITHYDLLARSALVRALLTRRRKFTAITVLTFARETTLGEQSFVSAVGEPLDLLRESTEFELRLLSAAPQARQLLSRRSRAQAQDPR